MTPAMQSKLAGKDTIGAGNCFAAALASLLDLPLWMVPPFEEMFWRHDEHWAERVDAWLQRMFRCRFIRTDGHQPERLPEFYLASGVSPRGVHHSVVYRAGELAHDPHPSGAGIASVEWTWHVEPIA